MTISGIVVTAGTFALFCVYLYREKAALRGFVNRIPLRIAVTGARGKSSVVRMIASILREDQRSVLAKTTGTQPLIYLPDGSEELIKRRGPVSILEQKRILRNAARNSVQAVVLEMMSIRPESLWTEARMLLQPDLLVFTNFRCDHREHWGHTRGDVLSALRSAITPGCKVFLPEEEDSPDFQEAAAEIGADQVLIPPLGQEELQSLVGDISSLAFEPNLRLAAAVAQHLGIDREQALSALKRSVSDADGLKVWGFGPDKPTRSWYFVNAFAANEPESTRLVLDKLHAFSGLEYSRVFAVLNLRSDRPDRTQQWLEAVQRDEFPEIVRFYVSGRHARAFKQKACRSLPDADIHVLKKRTAAEVFDVLSAEAAGAMVLGMGNLGGLGGCLVKICRSKGIPHVV